MSMGPTIIKFAETSMRQHLWGYTFGIEPFPHFNAAAGHLTAALGNGNGSGGNILTFCSALRDAGPIRVEFTGFSNQATIRFDHYAGKYVNGHIEPNLSSGIYHLTDPLHPEKNGYFMLNEQHVPTNAVDAENYFNVPLVEDSLPSSLTNASFF